MYRTGKQRRYRPDAGCMTFISMGGQGTRRRIRPGGVMSGLGGRGDLRPKYLTLQQPFRFHYFLCLFIYSWTFIGYVMISTAVVINSSRDHNITNKRP